MKLSSKRLAEVVKRQRSALSIKQVDLSKATGINRALLSRLENEAFTPSVDQLCALAEVLKFRLSEVLVSEEAVSTSVEHSYKVAVAGTGYVGLSLAVLLAQHNEVTAVDILPEKKQDDPIPPKTADTMEVTWMLVLLGFALTTAMLAARRRKEEKNMRA